ncbi:hypothetical protein [Amycolatopsis sp. cmx-11-51]|uniref:hypothetical protein n=1 Tax=unclassified Amycolatopsis TaxID=2618356 RepID=UPI0039E33053
MLSYRLFVSETTLGSLNLHSRAHNAFGDQADDDGGLFATHAAIALIGAKTKARLHIAEEHRDAPSGNRAAAGRRRARREV